MRGTYDRGHRGASRPNSSSTRQSARHERLFSDFAEVEIRRENFDNVRFLSPSSDSSEAPATPTGRGPLRRRDGFSGISEKSSGAHSALTWPRVYWGLQVLFGGRRGHAAFVGDYVRPDRGTRVLDLGCGSGEMVRQMDGADYLGVDRNPRYISAAQSRFGHLGTFRCADLADLKIGKPVVRRRRCGRGAPPSR